MLNNVNSLRLLKSKKVEVRGLSKSKKVEVMNFPGATSTDIVQKIDHVLKNQPKSLIM